MKLWWSLRRSLRRSSSSLPANSSSSKDGQEIFNFPYGTKEVVVRNEKALVMDKEEEEEVIHFDCLSEHLNELQQCIHCKGSINGNKLVQIRSRPSGRYGMFRDLWALRLSSLGALDLQGGLPFSTVAAPPGSPTTPPETRRMADSAIQVTLPFKENHELFGDYVNIYGGVRFGKVMEDLDVFAATCAYMHCGTSSASPSGDKLTIVTAAVDRIDVQMRLDEPVNLKMKGMVTWVGTSSMEVTIRVESTEENVDGESGVFIDQADLLQPATDADKWKLAAIAKFIMVAKDSQGPFKVPRLIVESAQEKEIVRFGEERSKVRLARAQQSLFREPPTAAESIELHRLFVSSIKGAVEDGKIVPISSTTLSTTKICHPQERNIHDYIFGGYLMREAFELGYLCGQMACRARLSFLSVDELAFKHPVPIDAVLQLNAQVVYSTGDLIHVEVIADVVSVQSGERKTTNTFHFTYRVEDSHTKIIIKPSTYVEAMKYLEGKRRIESAPQNKNYSEIYRW